MTNAWKCRRLEPLLALAAGGDLSPARSRVVEEHLRECSACRETAGAFAATMHTLRELPALELSPDERAELRRSVWRRIELERGPSGSQERGSGAAWATAGWATGAVLVILALLLPWRGAQGDRASGQAVIPPSRTAVVPPLAGSAAPVSAAPERSPAPRIAGRRTPRRARPLPEPRAAQPIRIELSTPDPDVRIVWLVGPPGDPLPPLSDEFATSADETSTIKENPE